jgi:conjugal transfer/entry exclusion protein
MQRTKLLNPLLHDHQRLAMLLAAVAIFASTPRPAFALFGIGDVISDPWAQAKNVEKVASLLLQLQQMEQQLDQLRAQLADLDGLLDDPGGDAFERAGEVMDGLTALRATLDRWQDALPAEVDPQTMTVNDLPAHNAKVREYLQDRLVQTESSLAVVEENRQAVTIEVAAIVQAGNAAEGSKSAQQAANQLQAILTSEQAKLQALKTMRSRLAADADAAAQAEEAAAEAVRQREMAAMRSSADQLRDEGRGGMTGTK